MYEAGVVVHPYALTNKLNININTVEASKAEEIMMESSTEAQNQVQFCLDKLSEFCKTTEDRVGAINMAWDGFKQEEDASKSMGSSFLIGSLLLMPFLWTLFGILEFSFWVNFWTGLFGIFTLLVGWGIALNQKGLSHRRKMHMHLQQLASNFLKEGYSIWMNRGLRQFEAAMVNAAGAVQIIWKQSMYGNEPNGYIYTETGPDIIKPNFSKAKQINMIGYIATAKSLMVFPTAAAQIKRVSLWQSVTDDRSNSKLIVLDVLKTSARFARDRKCEREVIISGLRNLSCAELYFSDMITAEYSASAGKTEELKVTTRDGRSFGLQANPEVVNLVREAIRASK